jgi:hypothetical protein
VARAHRHYIPGHARHLTHRCHSREFLLKFAKDRHRWSRRLCRTPGAAPPCRIRRTYPQWFQLTDSTWPGQAVVRAMGFLPRIADPPWVSAGQLSRPLLDRYLDQAVSLSFILEAKVLSPNTPWVYLTIHRKGHFTRTRSLKSLKRANPTNCLSPWHCTFTR